MWNNQFSFFLSLNSHTGLLRIIGGYFPAFCQLCCWCSTCVMMAAKKKIAVTELIGRKPKTSLLISAFHEIHMCAIMQDAESSNYASMRNSNNTAQVSSAVQAWFHFMKLQVIEESHRVLPNDVACRLSSYVLSQSLNKWLLRYSSVKPSFGRLQQMRVDLFAILQYTRWVHIDRHSIYRCKISFRFNCETRKRIWCIRTEKRS